MGEELLAYYIQSHAKLKFKWGENDCVTFAIGWLEQQTGRDYLTQYRPWHTAREANKILKRLNGLFFLFNEHLNRINPNMANDGDLTIYEGAACLYSGRHIVSLGKTGLVFVDRSMTTEAWQCRS